MTKRAACAALSISQCFEPSVSRCGLCRSETDPVQQTEERGHETRDVGPSRGIEHGAHPCSLPPATPPSASPTLTNANFARRDASNSTGG